MMKNIYIHGSSHEKTVHVQLNRRRRPLRREALKYSWLSIQIREPMMKVRSGISKGMESIRNSMDPRAKE
jgi:hypothetical protein